MHLNNRKLFQNTKQEKHFGVAEIQTLKYIVLKHTFLDVLVHPLERTKKKKHALEYEILFWAQQASYHCLLESELSSNKKYSNINILYSREVASEASCKVDR